MTVSQNKEVIHFESEFFFPLPCLVLTHECAAEKLPHPIKVFNLHCLIS